MVGRSTLRESSSRKRLSAVVGAEFVSNFSDALDELADSLKS
jgi:hypothetical protein